MKAAQSRVDLAKALFDQASDMQKNGVGTGIDTLRANVQYQNERQRLIDSETELKTSLYGLARLLNLEAASICRIGRRIRILSHAGIQRRSSVERAFTERPEMKALASQMRVRRHCRSRKPAIRRLPKAEPHRLLGAAGSDTHQHDTHL